MFNSGYQLKVVEGPGFGRVVPLTTEEISLGRAQDAHQPSSAGAIYFFEGTVSRVHAALSWDDRSKAYRLKHLSKTNHTKVNGREVLEQILEIGDRIGMGRLLLEVQKSPQADHLRSDLLVLPGAPPSLKHAPPPIPQAQLCDSLPAEMSGKRLGDYQLIRELGRGSVGRVYLARDVRTQEERAIKILAPEATRDPSFVQRFQMEARVASSLRHPNIIQVVAIHVHEGLVYLVMECLSPVTLQALIDRVRGPFPIPRILRILEQLLSALDHAHSRGVVHRDVKPGNILIDESRDSIALTDFSIAKVKDGVRLTSTGVLLGTVEYMAPELFDGQPPDPRADLYAVGVILYELLTGISPFRGRTHAEVIRAQLLSLPAHPRTYNSLVPDWLVQMNFILLQKNPDYRFGSACDVRQQLLEYGQFV